MEARALLVTSRLPESFTLVAREAMRGAVPVIAFADVDCKEADLIGGAIAGRRGESPASKAFAGST